MDYPLRMFKHGTLAGGLDDDVRFLDQVVDAAASPGSWCSARKDSAELEAIAITLDLIGQYAADGTMADETDSSEACGRGAENFVRPSHSTHTDFMFTNS